MSVYTDNENKDRKTGALRMSFEQLLFLCFIVVFIVLAAAQAAILIPSTRSLISKDNPLEGVPLGREEYLYETGEIRLSLITSQFNGNLKVLVNGDETADFSNSKDIRLKVKQGDIIELDASGLDKPEEISIEPLSPELAEEYITQRLRVDSGIVEVTRIRIK